MDFFVWISFGTFWMHTVSKIFSNNQSWALPFQAALDGRWGASLDDWWRASCRPMQPSTLATVEDHCWMHVEDLLVPWLTKDDAMGPRGVVKWISLNIRYIDLTRKTWKQTCYSMHLNVVSEIIFIYKQYSIQHHAAPMMMTLGARGWSLQPVALTFAWLLNFHHSPSACCLNAWI